MVDFQGCLAVAAAEMRSSRRLARTWVFGVLALLFGVLTYLYYSVLQGLLSGLSASFGMINPRFIMAGVGSFFLWVLLAAMIFLAFDVRARDARQRMAEVLDARPVGNLTLLAGRLTGMVVVIWVPLLLLCLIMQGIGALSAAFDWSVGELIHPGALTTFLFLDAPTALVFFGAVVFLSAVLFRNRLVVMLVALALLGVQIWATWRLPLYLAPAFSGLTAATMQVASDVLPRWPLFEVFAQRAAMLLIAAGFMVVAAALYPRPDRGKRTVDVGVGAALVAVGAVAVAIIAIRAGADLDEREAWRQYHEARRDATAPLLTHVAGRVTIVPGDRLELALDYQVTAPAGADQQLAFTLNPGMAVRSVRIDGAAAVFEHRQGLLNVTMPDGATGDAMRVSFEAAGVPNPAFAYLDSSLDLATASADAGTLALLGTDAAIYEDAYVALVPGVFWMPLPGVAVGGDEPGRYGNDYFTMDLQVSVPPTWLVAGPGRRVGEAGEFRFKPAAPVPAIGLLASRFERRALTVADVEFELLIAPVHLRNVERFVDVAAPLEERLRELLEGAARLGLPYPYQALSLVEIPSQLRCYGGGWRLPSVQSLPGVLMLREYGWPTSRFESTLADSADDEEQSAEQKGARLLRVLENFFANDVTGGNPLYGAVQNLFGFQTGATGRGAVALDFVLHNLAVQLVADQRAGFFSPYGLAGQSELMSLIGQSMNSFLMGQAGSIVDSIHTASTRRPSVWDRALGVSLADMDPREDPQQAVNVLWLKGPEIAQALLDGLGRETAGALLAEVRRRHAGGNYDANDLTAAGKAVGADMEALLGDWLGDAALPGFLTSPVRIARLTDDEQGDPRYQLSVHVRNAEAVPGLVRVGYYEEAGTDATAPIRVPGHSSVEIGMVAKLRPRALTFRPYLSLNRSEASLEVPADDGAIVDSEPFVGGRPSDWRPESDGVIVVDDLDPGFQARRKSADSAHSSDGGFWALSPELDQGLPQYDPFAPEPGWTRQQTQEAWGKYRRTLARAVSGDGMAEVVFMAELPAAGRWRLEYYLPAPQAPLVSVSIDVGDSSVRAAESSFQATQSQGSYDMWLIHAGDKQVLEFDGGASEPGWNRIGDFDLAAGEVRVAVSNKSEGSVVFADAIRWRPVTP